jgi:hypothetical protein
VKDANNCPEWKATKYIHGCSNHFHQWWGISFHPEEVGQPIRRIWANISTNQIAPFSTCSRTKLVSSKIYIGLINIDFWGNFTRYYFYSSQSSHRNGILKGKRHFPVYFDLSLRRYAVAMEFNGVSVNNLWR